MSRTDKIGAALSLLLATTMISGFAVGLVRERHDRLACEAAGGDLWKDRKCLKTEEVPLTPEDISHG